MSTNMPHVSKFKLAKGITSFIAGAGAGSIASNAAKTFIPADANVVKKVTCIVGAFAISGIAADAASKYTNHYFDDTYVQVQQMKKVWKEEQDKRKNEKKDDK
jgi:uncharacterized protein (DUF697 family)